MSSSTTTLADAAAHRQDERRTTDNDRPAAQDAGTADNTTANTVGNVGRRRGLRPPTASASSRATSASAMHAHVRPPPLCGSAPRRRRQAAQPRPSDDVARAAARGGVPLRRHRRRTDRGAAPPARRGRGGTETAHGTAAAWACVAPRAAAAGAEHRIGGDRQSRSSSSLTPTCTKARDGACYETRTAGRASAASPPLWTESCRGGMAMRACAWSDGRMPTSSLSAIEGSQAAAEEERRDAARGAKASAPASEVRRAAGRGTTTTSANRDRRAPREREADSARTARRERTLLDVTLPEVAQPRDAAEAQAAPSPSPRRAGGQRRPSTVLGVPQDGGMRARARSGGARAARAAGAAEARAAPARRRGDGASRRWRPAARGEHASPTPFLHVGVRGRASPAVALALGYAPT